MASRLFQPLALRDLEIGNRIVVSPMCQYSAVDGSMNDWHLAHLGGLSQSGAGLVIFEMTDVEPQGRITPGCSGLWSDANEAALARVVSFCRAHGTAKLGIQLAHAGRKAARTPPWAGSRTLRAEEGAWVPVGPSPIAADENSPVPSELDRGQIQAIVRKFAQAARRADGAGIDAIELHGAHGYLLHQFLSPLSNQRSDEYGGLLENRMRLTLEVFAAVRAAWPSGKPLGIRLSCTDWVEGGWDMEQTLRLVEALRQHGCDWIDCSSGGTVRTATAFSHPESHVEFSERIRRETGITTMAVGLITRAKQAESILEAGKADLVAIARGFLWDPRWAWHAALELGAEPAMPKQYLRGRPAP